MSSDVQSAVEQLQANYTALAIVVAMSYDYCLTFSTEVTYVWGKPWTWVSTLFLVIRYGGFLSASLSVLVLSTFIPGQIKNIRCKDPDVHSNVILTWLRSCRWTYFMGNWTFLLFWAAADMVMILRVYAMYIRSRIVLCFLLAIYVPGVFILFMYCVVFSDPSYVTVSVEQQTCSFVFRDVSTQKWLVAYCIFQFIFGAVLCLLALAQFARDSLQTYQTTRRWQSSRYMNLLTRDGLLYYLATIVNAVTTLLSYLGVAQTGLTARILLNVLIVPVYGVTLRFVLNIRELYDARCHSPCDIDSGFGLSGRVGRTGGMSSAMTTMSFMESSRIGGLDEEMATGSD